ncbi:hypothetical protein V495_05260 [Pseudogymnoascus sp. VKM F-4514 (FW-929)]|nr:hypothetical protein V495_05260 [Pseudogymnoascus sp. VKM F-4514 (FW-929)]KFY53747.1 hypothetical protein V497_08257 [Pseudogymnoascus sp. VKM F-4516 (FW-969)]
MNASKSGLRTALACAPCRLSKTKCNGQEPCARCKDRGIVCIPGVKRRNPVRKPAIPSLNENSRMDDAEAPESSAQADLLKEEVHCSIWGSEASESSTMNLHYGPSSTFVFLQQLHRFLLGSGAPRQSTINSRSTNYTAEAISEFGYSGIFFGNESDNKESAAGLSQELPSFDLAATFLELYLTTVHYAVLFCDKGTLRKLFYNMYSAQPSNQNSRDSTLVMAVLAIGAFISNYPVWADSLYRRVVQRLDSWGDSVSLRSVQISMLLSEYHHSQGRPNSAMLSIGRAVHKAFAVGLHRDMPSQGGTRDSTESDRSRERQTTFWSLFAHDRNVSLSLGRPASINELDIDVQDPSWDSGLMAAVALGRISYKVNYNIYGRNRGSISDLCRKVQEIYEEMIALHRSLPQDQKFPLSESELGQYSANLTASQMILAFHFFQTMIITLRPCLVLDAARRRSTKTSTVSSEAVTRLNGAADRCRDASIHIINVFYRAIKVSSFISCMRHSRFFIEGACFALLFDVVRDPARDGCERNFEAIEQGLNCFTLLPADRLLMISTAGVGRILELTKQMVATARAETNDKVDNQLPSSMDFSGESIGFDQGQALGEGLWDEAGISNNNIFDMSYYLWCEDP